MGAQEKHERCEYIPDVFFLLQMPFIEVHLHEPVFWIPVKMIPYSKKIWLNDSVKTHFVKLEVGGYFMISVYKESALDMFHAFPHPLPPIGSIARYLTRNARYGKILFI